MKLQQLQTHTKHGINHRLLFFFNPPLIEGGSARVEPPPCIFSVSLFFLRIFSVKLPYTSRSLESKTAFFGSRVTHLFFMVVEKRPDLKDAFASLEVTLENSDLHCLRILVGMRRLPGKLALSLRGSLNETKDPFA